MDQLILKTKCCPTANGRLPQSGDQKWDLAFPLEDGRQLILSMGKAGYETMGQFLLDCMADTPSYGDDSVNWPKP